MSLVQILDRPAESSGDTILLEFVSTHPLHPQPRLVIPLTPAVALALSEELDEAAKKAQSRYLRLDPKSE